LQVEGRAVAPEGIAPYHLWRFARRHAEQLVLTNVDEIPVAVGMPQRTLGEDKAGGGARGFSGFKHFWQIVRCWHDALLSLGPCDAWQDGQRGSGRYEVQKIGAVEVS